MKKIKPINGTVVIKLKHTMNDRTESGLYKDITFDVHGKMMIYAEVVSVSEGGSSEVMLEINTGAPKSKDSSVEPVYVRNRDTKHDIREGDRVYFHYLTLEDPKNFLWVEGEVKFFKVPIHDCFLSMREDSRGEYIDEGVKKRAFMHNQYVLGTEYWGEGWESIEVDGKMVAGKVNSFGMVIETKETPLENYSTITDIRAGIKPYSRHREVKAGDVALLAPNCEFKNEIEHKERWVFTHQDILAVLRKSEIVPVVNMVLIKLKERVYTGKIIVDTTKLNLEEEGTIVSVGGTVDEILKVGSAVKFSSGGARVIDDTHVLVKDYNIYGILSYAL